MIVPSSTTGIFYLSNDLELSQIEKVYERITDYYLLDKSEYDLDALSRYTIDPKAYENNWEENSLKYTYLMRNDREQKIFINIQSLAGAQTKEHPSIIRNGRRQVMVSLSWTETEEDISAYSQDACLWFGFNPLFCLIGHRLHAYLGYWNDGMNFRILGEPIRTLDKGFKSVFFTKDIHESRIIQELNDLGMKLSKDSSVLRDKSTIEVVDGNRYYEIRSDINRVIILDITKSKTLRDIEYIEEMLRFPVWYDFYFDSSLACDIGLEILCNWTGLLMRINEEAYFVGLGYPGLSIDLSKDDFDSMKTTYRSYILPAIIKRIKKE